MSALAKVTDSATGITTTYYYGFTDRMMKYVETGTGYSHSSTGVAAFQCLESTKRDKYLKKLREKGVSIRQLSRLTGVSVSVIRKVQ